MVISGQTAEYNVPVYIFKTEHFQFFINYDASNCGIWHIHHLKCKPEDYDKLFAWLYEAKIPYESEDYTDSCGMFVMSGVQHENFDPFFEWCQKNHPDCMTRSELAYNPNSGNLIYTYAFYTKYGKEKD